MEENIGYRVEEDKHYIGQAFCDDGLFITENKKSLQKVSSLVSAFCEIYKVKINATKSYYTVDRGKSNNAQVVKNWRPGYIELWDHTANEGKGQWQIVKECKPNVPIRYLGVLVLIEK
jgi:hypothetical protein